MSDANLTSLASVRETSIGVAPNDGLKLLRFTKESLGFKKETVTSAEVRADRQVADSVKVFGQPAGSIDFECSFGQLIPALELALMSSWNVGEVTATVDVSGHTLTGTAGDFSEIPLGALVAISGLTNADDNGYYRTYFINTSGSNLQLMTTRTFATESDVSVTVRWKSMTNGTTLATDKIEKRLVAADGSDYYSIYKGMAADTLDLTVESKKIVSCTLAMMGSSFEISDTTTDPQQVAPQKASGTLTFSNNPTNGDTFNVGGRQYTFVSTTPDVANEIKIGAMATDTVDNVIEAINGTGDLEIGPDTIANAKVSAARGTGNQVRFTAREFGSEGNEIDMEEQSLVTTVSGATLAGGIDGVIGYIAASVDPIVNGTNNFGSVWIDGTAASDKFKGVKIKIANNLRGKDACGIEGNFDIGLGRFEVSGSLNAYFRDNTLPLKALNHTSFGLEFYIENTYGGRIYFYLPAIKPTGDPQIEGVNTDVMMDTSFEAVVGDNHTGRTLIIDHVDID